MATGLRRLNLAAMRRLAPNSWSLPAPSGGTRPDMKVPNYRSRHLDCDLERGVRQLSLARSLMSELLAGPAWSLARLPATDRAWPLAHPKEAPKGADRWWARAGAPVLPNWHEQIAWGCRVVTENPDGHAVEITNGGPAQPLISWIF